MFFRTVKLVLIAFIQLVPDGVLQAMANVTSKPALPNVFMRKSRLMELFSESNSFFAKRYPNNPNPQCPIRARLPLDLQSEICKYVLESIIAARIAHGDWDDTVSATLKRNDIHFGLKMRIVEEFLKNEPSLRP